MSEKERRYWERYIGSVAEALRLGCWEVHLLGEPCSDGYAATMECTYGKHTVTVKLSADWSEFAPLKQRRYIVHELLHTHMERADTYVFEEFKYRYSGHEAKRRYEEYSYLREFAIEDYARLVNEPPKLPLLPKPPKSGK